MDLVACFGNKKNIFNINYVAETNKGCLDSANSLIEVLAPPVASYSAPDSGCGPFLVDFTNNSIGKDVSYLWDFGFDNYIKSNNLYQQFVLK